MSDSDRSSSPPPPPSGAQGRTGPSPTIHKPQPDIPSARGKDASPTIWETMMGLKFEDFKKVHMVPCAREAFLAGIAAGFAFGGLKLVLRGTIPSATNWAAGTFCGTSIVVYETCHLRRYRERVGMQRAVEIIERQAREKGGATVVRSKTPIVPTRERVGGEAEREGPIEQAAVPISARRAGIQPGVEGGGSRAKMVVGGEGEGEKVEIIERQGGIGRTMLQQGDGGGGEGGETKKKEGGKSWYKFW